jgi:dCTP deaminase
MILSDGEIISAIESRKIAIDPPLEDEYLKTALTTSALDLRLGDELHTYRSLDEVMPLGITSDRAIDPTVQRVIPDLVTKWGEKHSIADGTYTLQPGQFILGATLEVIELPESGCLAARVEGKSTLARLGFVAHMTAPTIHAGFRGTIVLEMYNFGPYPIKLAARMRVCQVIFEALGQVPQGGQLSQYQDQSGPE